jgi:hypothetical protein
VEEGRKEVKYGSKGRLLCHSVVWMYVRTYVCTFVCMYKYICMYARMYVFYLCSVCILLM